MTTLVDVVFDLLVVEQLHDAVPCEGIDEAGCDAPAAWSYRHSCGAAWSYRHSCGEAWLYCTTHRAELDEWQRVEGAGYCDLCNAPMPRPMPWLPL